MHRPTGWRGYAAITVAVLMGAGCHLYKPVPLDPDSVLTRLDARHRAAPTGATATLADAFAAALVDAPELREVRAQAHAAQRLADLETPLPNPTIGVGAFHLSGADVPSSARWGLEAALGWAFDLAGLRSRSGDLRTADAVRATTDVLAAERDLLLGLRRSLAALAAARHRARVLDEAAQLAAEAEDLGRRLVAAAQATALDLAELSLDARRAHAAAMLAAEEADVLRHALAARSGLPPTAFDDVERPEIPDQIPSREALRDLLVRGKPALDVLRAEFDLAEASLRHEIAAQVPWFGVDGEFEEEEDADRYALGVGVELPIFDRNQLGIAAAEGDVAAARARFEAAVERGGTSIDAARSRLERRVELHRYLADHAAPTGREALRLAGSGMRSGALDALHFLAVSRAERDTRLALIDAEAAVVRAWCDLEDACGAPLLRFPSMADLPAPQASSSTAPDPTHTTGETR